jgi:hypothetical protein
MKRNELRISYDLEICYGDDEIKELHEIDFKVGIMNLEEVKAIDYQEIYLITVIKDAEGNIIKRSHCRVV